MLFIYVKNSFRFRDIYIFLLTFWLGRKHLDKKAKINLQTDDVTDWKTKIAIHILPNISRSKGNQTIKFGQ